MVDILADAINTIKVHEGIGRDTCIVPDTKLVKSVMEVLKKAEYILGYDTVKERTITKLSIRLAKRVNDIGVIKPRFAVSVDEYQKYETRFIPSRDFGILIVSTPKGIMTNKEAKEQHTGGRLLAYVY